MLGDSTKARCKICGTTFQAHMKSITGHCEGKKHKENISASTSKGQTSITQSVRPVELDATKVAELKLAVYVTDHSATLAIDHLGELMPQLDKNSKVLQNIKIHRSKCARLQRNVLAPSFAKELRDDIGNQYFSLLVDESTNTANVSCLALTVRYYSSSKREIVSTFYRLVPLEDCTANSLYNAVKSVFEEDNLSVNKLIGIGCDGANAMIGRNHSLVTLLQRDNPNITVFRCVCHSLHLAASKASEGLPSVLNFIVRDTHNWFSNSPKRINSYRDVYKVLNEDKTPVKVPGLAATRWLARLDAMTVIIDQWDALKVHFEMAASSERCHTARMLSDAYKSPDNKLYMLYTRKLLKEVVKVNTLFQAENADVTKLTHDLLILCRNLLQKIVEPKYLSRIPNEKLQDFKFNDYIIPLASIDFGYEFNTFLATCKLTKDQVMYIKERCKTFAVDLITEVQARLPDNVDTLLMFKCLHPNVVLSGKESISKIGDRYRNVIEDMDELENEWSSLTLDEWPQTSKANIVSFWAEVSEKKNSAGEKVYPNVTSLALALLSLPFSNASVERVFSRMNNIHSKSRNRLHVKSVEAILQITYGLMRNNKSCATFTPSETMVKNFNAKDAGWKEVEEDEWLID